MADPQKRAEAVEQMVAIVAADGDLGRTSCEELLRSTGWNVEVRRLRHVDFKTYAKLPNPSARH